MRGNAAKDQVGFVPGRQARENTIKTLLHQWLSSKKAPGFLLSVDAEKAFDRVAWDYLHALESLGLPPTMLAFIGTWYSNPTAKIRVKGTLSQSFPISKWYETRMPLIPPDLCSNIGALITSPSCKPRYQCGFYSCPRI